MAQSYKLSNQAKTGAGYGQPDLPKGAPPVPTFLPAKTPPPGVTTLTQTALPPRAGGEVTQRVADEGDYTRAYAQARSAKEAQAPATRPATGGVRRPAPSGVPGAITGPAGTALPPMAGPPMAAPTPDRDLLSRYALATQAPSFGQLSALPALPGSEYAPLYSEAPSPPEDAPPEDAPPAEGDAEGEEVGPAPEGQTPEEWEKAKSDALSEWEYQNAKPWDVNNPFDVAGQLKKQAWEEQQQAFASLMDKYASGEELTSEEITELMKYGAIDETKGNSMKAAFVLGAGKTELTDAMYEGAHAEGTLPRPDGMKWESSGEGTWKLVPMTEDELLEQEYDTLGEEMKDDSGFIQSLQTYAKQMDRKRSEAQFLAGSQMSQSGIWQTGLGARRMMQVDSAIVAEMSATMSDMIVQHQKDRWTAQLAFLQGKTSIWAQRKTIELQATQSAFDAAMQGPEMFAQWMDAENLGEYMNDYWAKVKTCQEFGDAQSLSCIFGLFEDFRVDHEGNLAFGTKTKNEHYDYNAWQEAKAVKKCGSCWNPGNWGCCWGQSDSDERFSNTTPNPKSGKYYTAGGHEKYG